MPYFFFTLSKNLSFHFIFFLSVSLLCFWFPSSFHGLSCDLTPEWIKCPITYTESTHSNPYKRSKTCSHIRIQTGSFTEIDVYAWTLLNTCTQTVAQTCACTKNIYNHLEAFLQTHTHAWWCIQSRTRKEMPKKSGNAFLQSPRQKKDHQ